MSYHNVSCWFFQHGCVVNWDSAPAWIQALLSAAAIWWASKSAMKQVAAQHKNDKLLRNNEFIDKQIILITALKERVNLIKGATTTLFANSGKSAMEGRTLRKFEIDIYVNAFQDSLEDIKNLSIYELKNPEMIILHISLRSAIREIQFNCNIFVSSNVVYTQDQFKEYGTTLIEAIKTLNYFENQLTIELENIKTNKNSIYIH